MRQRKFNLENNLFDLVANLPTKEFPSIEGGHLWDFREIGTESKRVVAAQGIKKPFSLPCCAKELARFIQVNEIRGLFQEKVEEFGIEAPEECINRWLFDQLSVPRSDQDITIFDSNAYDNTKNHSGESPEKKQELAVSAQEQQDEALLRCPKNTDLLREQLLQNLPAPISIPWKQKDEMEAVKKAYCLYLSVALAWIDKWLMSEDPSQTESDKDELRSQHKALRMLGTKIQRVKSDFDLHILKDEALTACTAKIFTSRFSNIVDDIIQSIVSLAEEHNKAISAITVNPKEELVDITTIENNQQKLTYNNNEVIISGLHYLKLQELFRIHCGQNRNDSPDEYDNAFARAIYVLARRYATFFGENGKGEGFHAAAPESAFEVMRNSLSVAQELFASPFNCHFATFCSAFPDIDCWFGSCGSAFDFVPVSGSYEVGPPYVAGVMDQTADMLESILQKSTGPLSFIIFVPEWKAPIAKYHQIIESSDFLKLSFVMGGNDHAYIVGDQHTSDTRYVKLPFRTCVYVMQNSLGAELWPVAGNSFQKELENALRKPIELKKPKKTSTARTNQNLASNNHRQPKKESRRRGKYAKFNRYQEPPNKVHKSS